MKSEDGSSFNRLKENSVTEESANIFIVKIVYANRKEEISIEINTDLSMDALAETISSHITAGVFGFSQNEKMILIPSSQVLRIEICNVDYVEPVDEVEIEDCMVAVIKFLTDSTGAKRLTSKLGFKPDVLKLATQRLVEDKKIKLVSWGKYSLVTKLSF